MQPSFSKKTNVTPYSHSHFYKYNNIAALGSQRTTPAMLR